MHKMDRKESSFMGLVGFECPLRDEMKLLLEEENLDSVLKSISTRSPACILNLKMLLLKLSVPKAKFFEFLESSISKWKSKHEIKNILTSPKNPIFQHIMYIIFTRWNCKAFLMV